MFNGVEDVDVKLGESLTKYSTFRLRSTGNIAIVKSEQGLIALLERLRINHIQYRLLGWGANQILLPDFNGIYIKLNFFFQKEIFEKVQETYDLPASVGLNILTSHATKFGLVGWEVFTGIPGTIGGAIVMNAGTALGEFGSLVKSVKILRESGHIESYEVGTADFSYRHNNFLREGDVVLSAKLIHFGLDPLISKKISDYLTYRSSTQPLQSLTCGCVFQNYNNVHRAGRDIDLVGLKGFGLGGVRISSIHGNFMENFQDGTYNDFMEMVKVVKEELYLNYGVKYLLEVKIN